MTLRLLSYNIRHGGAGRVESIAAVIRHCAPDVVVLQEATRPDVVRALAGETGLPQHGSHRGQSLGFLSRIGIATSVCRRPLLSRHAFLDLTLEGHDVHIVGVHLSAIHAAWTERRRLIELASLLRAVKARQHGFHVLAGDFNTLAPGESLDVRRLPARLRPLVWLSALDPLEDDRGGGGGRLCRCVARAPSRGRWRHVPDLGPASPAGLRVAPATAAARVVGCEVVTVPETMSASDHHPLVAEIELMTAPPRAEPRPQRAGQRSQNGRRLDPERAQIDIALAAMMDLVVDPVEQQPVITPWYWPKAVSTAWKRRAGCRPQRVDARGGPSQRCRMPRGCRGGNLADDAPVRVRRASHRWRSLDAGRGHRDQLEGHLAERPHAAERR